MATATIILRQLVEDNGSWSPDPAGDGRGWADPVLDGTFRLLAFNCPPLVGTRSERKGSPRGAGERGVRSGLCGVCLGPRVLLGKGQPFALLLRAFPSLGADLATSPFVSLLGPRLRPSHLLMSPPRPLPVGPLLHQACAPLDRIQRRLVNSRGAVQTFRSVRRIQPRGRVHGG